MIVLILIATSMKHAETSVGGISVVQQTAMPMLSLWWGVSNAVGTRVGIGVGAGSKELCHQAIRVGLMQLLVISAPIIGLYICWAHGFASIVTDSRDIIELCEQGFPLVAIGLILTNLQELLGSVLAAAGENLKLTVLQVIYAGAFCGFGILCTGRTYLDLQMPGLLWAWNLATVTLLLLEIPLLICLDWESAFVLAEERNQMVEDSDNEEVKPLAAPIS
jgi:Na+-driven multidrug efflux pump